MRMAFFMFVLSGVCLGQGAVEIPPSPVTPATPTGFETRGTGSGSGVGVRVKEVERKVKKVHYIAVTESRVWTSADGRLVRAALLAYEQGPVREDSSEPLTLVRDGKIRLLLEKRKQLVEYALEKLSKADQAHVKKLVAAQERAKDEVEPNEK